MVEIALIIGILLVGLFGALLVWLWKRPQLPAAAPDSLPARIEHWLETDTPLDPVRHCPRCGRQRLVLTPFNYTSTSPASRSPRRSWSSGQEKTTSSTSSATGCIE